jgi:hypothetical protein
MNELLLRSTPGFAVRRLLAIANSLAICFSAGTLAVPCASAQGPFIYVANAGDDTVSKIDVASNKEVARYATWFNSGTNNLIAPHSGIGNAWAGPAPSRIARDSAGNAYVLNRFFSNGTGSCTNWSWSNPPHRPVLVKIASNSGPPTSVGPPLPITDSNNSNDIEAGEATDKAILWATSIGQKADEIGVGRALAIDPTGSLWVGMYCTKRYFKVNANTGSMIPPSGIPVSTGTHTPYSCVVDVNGNLWSVDEKNTLANINTSTSTFVGSYPHVENGLNYSLAVFNDCSTSPPTVKIYLSSRDDDTGNTGKTYMIFDPQTLKFKDAPLAPKYKFASVAIGIDSHGNIISGKWQGSGGGRVIKTSPSGANVWDTDAAGSTVPSSDLHGIIIDANDDVWAVSRTGGTVTKYSGVDGSKVATVKVGDQPYTYGNVPPATCSNTSAPTPTPTATAIPTPTPGCASVIDKEIRCQPDGSYSCTFTVTNNSGAPMSQVLLTPVTDGAFTLTPQLSNLSSPLPSGQSTTVTTNMGHVKPGEKVCFFLSLLSDNAPCCIVQVCPTLPRCGEVPSPIPSPTPQRR